MHFDFQDDVNWVQAARGRLSNIESSPDYRNRLNSASLHEETSLNNENTCQALTTLSRLGLVVETSQAEAISTTQYVATLLNYSTKRNKPYPTKFLLKVGTSPHNLESSIVIPPKSHLLLYRLSQSLQVDIFLFSSRAKVKVFKVEGAVGCLGFFHNIDSYYQTSEWLVLIPSRQSVVESFEKSPITPFRCDIPAAVFQSEKKTSSRKRKSPELRLQLEEECDRALKRAW
jgi:hypothetical protein